MNKNLSNETPLLQNLVTRSSIYLEKEKGLSGLASERVENPEYKDNVALKEEI